VKISETVIKHF